MTIMVDQPALGRLGDDALDQLFRKARSHHAWRPSPVSDAELRAIWELTRMGPTGTNSMPARILFLRTRRAKERLKPLLRPRNVEQTMSAPVTAIIGADFDFLKMLPKLFPHEDAIAHYRGDQAKIDRTARLMASLQAAYFIMAARSLGLDCGPVTGFDMPGADRVFFSGTNIRTLMLCNIGHGDPTTLSPRLPRLTFDEACTLL